MRSVWVYVLCLPCVTKLMELTELNSTSARQSHFFKASRLKTIESTLLGILVDLCEYTNAIQFFPRNGGERACRQTFEAAIPPSCNYPADHLSVRSLSVNQFRAWVTPGKINGKWVVFCSVWKQSEMEREPHRRFCKKSLISGKKIIMVLVFGVSRSKTLLVYSG